jgi:DNA polymerase III epsilon subunit-like protein
VKKYIILDTETTGNQEEDKIVQLAFLVVDKNVKKAVESFCKPSVDIKFEAMAVHHIVPEMLVNKPEFNQCEAAKILNELNNEENILIIQNAQFDLKMLEKEGFFWRGKLIDTLRCIKNLKKRP